MRHLVRLGIVTGLRANGFKGLFFIAMLVLGFAGLAAGFSGRQPATVAMDVGLSGMRIVLLLMALFWVQDLLARDIERKTIYFMLAYPISRARFLLARFVSVALLTLLATVLLGGLLLLVLWLFRGEYQQLTPVALDERYALVLLGVWVDLLVVIAFAVLLAGLATTPFLPLLIGLAFAMAARGLGSTFDYLRNSSFADPDQVRWFRPLLDYSYVWLPDLSRLDWRPLALYSLPVEVGAVGMALLMALTYIAALMILAILVFQRRNFT
jgi:ABC-type transport system involved in multi-copper enzyme maturation permease subunit